MLGGFDPPDPARRRTARSAGDSMTGYRYDWVARNRTFLGRPPGGVREDTLDGH